MQGPKPKEMENINIKDKVRQIFTEYLEKNGQRKTPERFAILDKIYSIDGHFGIEQLQTEMENDKFRVSRATIYNTITLLIDAALVVKHSFDNASQYEKSYNIQTRHHLICTECGKVKELKSEDLKNEIEKIKLPRFNLTHYSLYMYGICSSCKRVKTLKRKKQNKKL